MAGANSELDFDSWISERFRELHTDEAVFAPYIKSIVEGDETMEEKIDALDGILAELADESLDVEKFRKEILSRWEQQQNKTNCNSPKEGDGTTDIESKLKSILKVNDEVEVEPTQNESGGKGLKSLSQAPDSALRAAILSQYRDDDTDDDTKEESSATHSMLRGSGGGGSGPSNLERNTNAERVLNELKDKREKEKAESAKKRERDKEDRAKQKQQAQDRKEKAKKKATKVERKR